MANPHLRQVLDAEANTLANGGILYPTAGDATNSSDLLHIISEYASRIKFAHEALGLTTEEAGGLATASMQDSNGNFPDPFTIGESAGVQITFTPPDPITGLSLFPVGTYGTTIGVISNAGLRHYHHSIQMGLAIDGTYNVVGQGVGDVDYMVDNITGTGTGVFRDEILEAGKTVGTWDIDNISLGDLRGIQKPVPAVSGPSGIQTLIENFLVGDPSNSAPVGSGNYEVTGYSSYDGTSHQYGFDENSQNIRIGGGF